MKEAVLDFRIPPQPHLCQVVREAIVDFARTHGVDDDDLTLFLTALGEALANAIEHSGANGPVEVECRIGSDRIVATVQDSGRGFASDLTDVPELPDCTSERGRGLPIMRRLSDIFALNSQLGKGTAVVVGRYLRADGGPEMVA